MWATRRMALVKWQGMSTGGTAWFPDLTLPALDLSSTYVQQVAPLGTLGVVLPAVVTAAMFANVNLAFGRIGSGRSQSAPPLNPVSSFPCRTPLGGYTGALSAKAHDRTVRRPSVLCPLSLLYAAE